MAVYPAGFSERVFEFSFNAEYAARNAAVLAGVPHLPSQNQEKWLGYDVAFAIKTAGGAINTLALQHKVARKVDGASGTNWHFQCAVGLPYFAFGLDVDQYNLIQDVASAAMPGIEFYFCAPLFASRANIDKHYMAQNILGNSLWIDVAGSGELDASEGHSLVYAADGSSAAVFSTERRDVSVLKPRRERHLQQDRRRLTHKEFRKFYDVTFQAIKDYWPRRRNVRQPAGEEPLTMPAQLPTYQGAGTEDGDLRALRDLLCSYLGVSLLVETANPPSEVQPAAA